MGEALDGVKGREALQRDIRGKANAWMSDVVILLKGDPTLLKFDALKEKAGGLIEAEAKRIAEAEVCKYVF